MIARHLAKVLRAAARNYPVITLTGPRQSGKTTLARATFPRHRYVTLEDPDQREFALEDARGFLGQFRGPVVFDEIQRAPELFSYLQGMVDAEDRPGRFVLTGSQNFLLLNRVSQSLAGRCAVLHLLPLSWGELVAAPLRDIARFFKPRPAARGASLRTGANLFNVLFSGGFPRIHDKSLPPQDWLANYYQTYLERDVRDQLAVGDLETFGRFVRLCAGRSGQILNASSLATDAGVSHATARRWISLLEASFLVYLLRPHHENFNKRLTKSPKLYFLDTGLMCYLLRIRSADELVAHSSRGAVFETWMISEAVKNCLNRGVEPDIFFWRDSTGHELDLLIEAGVGRIPVEAKSGQTFASDFLAGIKYWRVLAKDPAGPAGVVYGGDSSYLRDRTAVLSWRDWA